MALILNRFYFTIIYWPGVENYNYNYIMEDNNYQGPIEAALSSDLRGAPHNFSLWDIHTGTQLVVFKGSKSSPIAKCLQFIDSDYFITATDNVLHIWSIYNRKCQTQKLFLPNRPSSLCLSPCGNYMIVGMSDMIYIWQIYSGNLLAHTQRHYQTVNVLKMTRDGTFLFSAGEDGMVLVWAFADLISTTHNTGALNSRENNTTRGVNEPIYTWQHNSSQVTDLFITNSGLCLTVSTDKTLNIYSYQNGKRLFCVLLPSPLWSVVMNRNETRAFVGGQTGDIFEVVVSSLGLARMNQLRASEDAEDSKRPVFVGHSDKVIDLFISIDGSRLVSASKDSTCKIWDIYERKLLHNIKHQAPLANLKSIIVPEAFALSTMTQSKVKPPLHVKPLKRSVYKMPRDTTLLSSDLFDEGNTTIINIKNRKYVSDERISGLAATENPNISAPKVASRPFTVSQSDSRIDRGDQMNQIQPTEGNTECDSNLRQKYRDLYMLSVEQIFRGAAEEYLQPYRGLAEDIIKIAPRCDKKARKQVNNLKRVSQDGVPTSACEKSSKKQKSDMQSRTENDLEQ